MALSVLVISTKDIYKSLTIWLKSLTSEKSHIYFVAFFCEGEK